MTTNPLADDVRIALWVYGEIGRMRPVPSSLCYYVDSTASCLGNDRQIMHCGTTHAALEG